MSEPTATSTAPPPGHAQTAEPSSESAFLDAQAQHAKAAVAAALSDAKAALAEGVDPATWARRYPFIAIGSALVAGFTTAVLAVPSKEQQELHRLQKIAEALNPRPPKPADSKEEKKDKPKEGGSSLWFTILKEALNFARPFLTALVTSHLQGQPESHDGHPDPAAPQSPPPTPYPPR